MPNAMTDTGELTAPDYIGDYLTAFQAGQALTPSDPLSPSLDYLTNALTGQIATSSVRQRDQATRRAELLGAIGAGLGSVPYAERPAILAHLAPALANEGIPTKAVVGFDPTDDAINSSIQQAHVATNLLKSA